MVQFNLERRCHYAYIFTTIALPYGFHSINASVVLVHNGTQEWTADIQNFKWVVWRQRCYRLWGKVWLQKILWQRIQVSWKIWNAYWCRIQPTPTNHSIFFDVYGSCLIFTGRAIQMEWVEREPQGRWANFSLFYVRVEIRRLRVLWFQNPSIAFLSLAWCRSS